MEQHEKDHWLSISDFHRARLMGRAEGFPYAMFWYLLCVVAPVYIILVTPEVIIPLVLLAAIFWLIRKLL